MRDAIVLSTWSWGTFNVPERIALALAGRGARVLYCEMPVSRLRRREGPVREIAERVYRFCPEYLGGKFSAVPGAGLFQWRAVAKQILGQANAAKLSDPLFLYSHIERMQGLCNEMRSTGVPLVHICMDYPEPYQYELIELSDQTLVIPKAVYRELERQYGAKIQWIPQSIHLPQKREQPEKHGGGQMEGRNGGSYKEPVEIAGVPRPRLGYLGPIHARLDLPVLREVMRQHPEWYFVYFGEQPASAGLSANARAMGWHSPEKLPEFVGALDVGFMPYERTTKKNLYCSPLKLYDYFWAGTPVVATPIPELSEFGELIYFGETAEELAGAVARALNEPTVSPKRAERKAVAEAHSTEALGVRLEHVLQEIESRQGQAQC